MLPSGLWQYNIVYPVSFSSRLDKYSLNLNNVTVWGEGVRPTSPPLFMSAELLLAVVELQALVYTNQLV